MDKDLFLDFTCGTYILSSVAPDGRFAGAAVNTVFQLTQEPWLLAACLNRSSFTGQSLRQSCQAAVTVLGQGVSTATLETFGFQTSAHTDKFSRASYALAPNGVPYLTQNALSWFSGPVRQVIPLPTHDLFFLEITHCGPLDRQEKPLTYAHYRDHKKSES